MYLVTDENWAMTVGAMARGGGSVAFLLGGGVLAWISWMSTNLIGYGLGSAIDDPAKWGLDFAFTATFLALLLGMWKGRGDIVPWLVAALAAILTSKFIDGSWHILVGGLAGSLVGAWLEVRKHVQQS
jgi:predicted branched-subunit amino acid permease